MKEMKEELRLRLGIVLLLAIAGLAAALPIAAQSEDEPEEEIEASFTAFNPPDDPSLGDDPVAAASSRDGFDGLRVETVTDSKLIETAMLDQTSERWADQIRARAERRGDLATLAALPPKIPDECRTLKREIPRWVFERFFGCSFIIHHLTLWQGGEEIGHAMVRVYEWNRLSRSSRAWTHYLDIENIEADGALIGGLQVESNRHLCVSVTSTAGGANNCRLLSTPLPGPTGIPKNVRTFRTFQYRSDEVADPITFHQTRSRLTYSYPSAENTVTNWVPPFKEIRCDSRPEFLTRGCVYTGSLTLTYFGLNQNIDEVATHIWAAQRVLTGSAGWGGRLNRLSETYNPTLYRDNRRLSRARCEKGARPPGDFECDEYPFASTWQGAAGARPPENFSAMYVNGRHNSAAGTYLGHFYTNCRVLDGYYSSQYPFPLYDPFVVEVRLEPRVSRRQTCASWRQPK